MKKRSAAILVGMIAFVLPFAAFGIFEYLKQRPEYGLHLPKVLSEKPTPEFQLTDQLGNVLTHDSLKGHIVVADFFFTTCRGICPELSSSMMGLQNYLIEKEEVWNTPFLLISHTVDPETDSVETLNAYADLYDADYNYWRFVTGPKRDIYSLATQYYLLPADTIKRNDVLEPFVHSERLVLLDREGKIRGFYDGTDEAAVKMLRHDLLTLDMVYSNEDKKKRRDISYGKDE